MDRIFSFGSKFLSFSKLHLLKREAKKERVASPEIFSDYLKKKIKRVIYNGTFFYVGMSFSSKTY